MKTHHIVLSALVALALLGDAAIAAPIAYWNFDNNALDQTANGNDGTLLGTAAYDAAATPPALPGSTHSVRFDGVDGSMVSINDGAGGMQVTNLPAFTISMWVLGGIQDDNRMFSEGSTTADQPLYNIGTSSPGGGGPEVDFYRRLPDNAVTNNHNLSTAVAFDDQWHHIALVDEAGAIELYIDGVFDRAMSYVDSDLLIDTTTIGGILRAAPCCSFNGAIDDVAIYDVALPSSDIALLAAGSAPAMFPTPDSDGDGLPDSWENAHMLDPNDDGTVDPVNGAAGDPDADGLTNAVEFAGHTDPQAADTDADGVNDNDEITNGTSPIDEDSDNDTVNDGTEVTAGTDPLDTDSDDDGVNDGTEIADASDPLDPDDPALAALLVAYWPLDGVDAGDPTVTPDETVNGYDLTLQNMSAANFVSDEGRNAASFDAILQTMLTRVHAVGDDLPINQHATFTVSFWTKTVGTGQSDLRLFSEGSTATNTPLFNIGTDNNGSDGVLDLYFRGTTGDAGHQHSVDLPLDGTWRHIALTVDQQTPRVALYIDGFLDRDNIFYRNSYQPEMDTTSLGGILRGVTSHWVTGLMDEVSLWKSILSPADIASLAAGGDPFELTGGLAPFIITAVARDSGTGDVTLTWNSRPGKFYTVRFSTDLLGDPHTWSDLTDGLLSQGDQTSYVDTTDNADAARYYVIEENL